MHISSLSSNRPDNEKDDKGGNTNHARFYSPAIDHTARKTKKVATIIMHVSSLSSNRPQTRKMTNRWQHWLLDPSFSPAIDPLTTKKMKKTRNCERANQSKAKHTERGLNHAIGKVACTSTGTPPALQRLCCHNNLLSVGRSISIQLHVIARLLCGTTACCSSWDATWFAAGQATAPSSK